MLEKMFGCTLVTKLRAILLMEADFNFSNKTIYGDRMMSKVREFGFMPEEIFSEKGKMADDGSLAKILFYDIVRQARIVAAIGSIDAANCYDSVAHAVASLIFQAFGVPCNAIEAMLIAIQNMKYFLRTAFGDSKNSAGSTFRIKYQGLCQGNGAASAGWAVISITIIGAHKRKGHGGFFVCPITKVASDMAAILFVDDTDILHIRMDKDETTAQAHSAIQASILSWGGLLMASGGAFKPVKCFFHLIAFKWRNDGSWKYDRLENDEQWDVGVPMPDGTMERIEHVPVDESRETLGVWSSPSGNNKAALQSMQTKAQEWLDRAKEGRMMRRDIWFLVQHQLWPKLHYGLGSNTASLKDLSLCLKKQYWQMMPLGGIIRSAPTALRQLDHGFFGAGLPHVGIECTSAQVNKLLMHYGCPSHIGRELTISLGFMTLEMGISTQPLRQSFSQYSRRVTHSWLKALWEKCDEYNINIQFNDGHLKFPREKDQWLMQIFEDEGYTLIELARLNRVRLHQQVVFLSCILGASGKDLDSKYLDRRPDTTNWSELNFPKEKPPRKDFQLWREALHHIAPPVGIQDRLGAFLHSGYKIWDWRIDAAGERILHTHANTMTVYTKSQQARYHNRTNRWDVTAEAQPAVITGKICSVKHISPSTVALTSTTEHVPEEALKRDNFLDILLDWGCTWMWDSLKVVGEDTWLQEAIADNSLMAVTDGSYIKEQWPDLCSASFILECTKGRGRLIGDFADHNEDACAYRGELLGLLAIHLILLAINKVHPHLTGTASIYSDCLGAIGTVATLPQSNIPARCRHSDILKIIMLHCSFTCSYAHVRAHQDDKLDYAQLERPAQLNVIVDFGAKRVIWNWNGYTAGTQNLLPLESVGVFVGAQKLTSGSSKCLRYWAHHQLARKHFFTSKVITPQQFREVNWPCVYKALHSVPRMFAVWACKQINNIAGTNANIGRYQKDHDRKCPSCRQVDETCAHVLTCMETGRVEMLNASIDLLNKWMKRVGTDARLRRAIIVFAKRRGSKKMIHIPGMDGARYAKFAESQDVIGWRRFMEGMVSKEMVKIQDNYHTFHGGKYDALGWTEQLVIRLLEVTHGQWLYRNVLVHDQVSGILATQRKERLQTEIEQELLLGGEGLEEADRFLLEINLEDLETTSGETQAYWLLAISAARAARLLRGQNTQNSTTTNRDGHNNFSHT